jgi:hypothetical protein
MCKSWKNLLPSRERPDSVSRGVNKSPAPLYSWEGHELNFEPRIWALLGILADEIYEGSRSRAANSILLFSAIHFFNERAAGRKPTHWLTAAAMKDGAQLESLLRTIEKIVATNEPEDIGKWWQHELDRRLQDHACPHCGAPLIDAVAKEEKQVQAKVAKPKAANPSKTARKAPTKRAVRTKK